MPSYDVIVLGAGLGGLLTAAQLQRRGQRVLVLERLAHCGGRFTAKTLHGAQVSTGAVHMLPFGTNGELAGMLRRLGVPHRIHDSEVFGSFHVAGRQVSVRSLPQLRRVLSPREMALVTQIGLEVAFGKMSPADRDLTAADWLRRRIDPVTTPLAWRFFERVTHFALSVDLPDIRYPELVETGRNLLRYGPPGVVNGGCAAITGELERRVLAGGGEIRLRQDVRAVTHEDGRVTGVLVRDQASGEESLASAPLIISNIAPEATRSLAGLPSAAEAEPALPRKEAAGLKVHLLSDHSIIPHKGIMFCLDTDRIAGIVQVTNADPRLAPPGKHLLITHQLMRSDDVNAEREAARADLRRLFGDAFGTSINILTMSQYRGEWPVNRARQGEDMPQTLPLAGLYLVGDAVKPSGYLMVEGVAQSVNTLFDVMEATTAKPATVPAARPGSHVPPKPARSRALRWLIAPPPPHPGS